MKHFLVVWVILMALCGNQPSWAQISDFLPDTVLTADQLNTLVDQINRNTATLIGTGTIVTVNCDNSETIGAAVNQANPGDTIQITGTCHETVTITKNGLTLDGQGTTTVDGGGAAPAVIHVEGAQNVTIKGLTVMNGKRGILGRLGAAMRLQDITAQNNTIVDDAGGEGIRLDRNASAIFTGTIVCNNNANTGLLVGGGSSAFFFNTPMVQANNNGDRGIQASQAASIIFAFGFGGATSTDMVVEANGNGADGFRVAESGNMRFISAGVEINPITVHANNNTGDGFQASRASAIALFGVNVTASGNARGLSMFENAAVTFSGNFSSPGGLSTPLSTLLLENNTNTALIVVRAATFQDFNTTVTVQNNLGSNAVLVGDGSHATLNMEIQDNAGDGLIVTRKADVDANNLTVTNNGNRGVVVSDGSNLRIRNSTISHHANAIALFVGRTANVNADNLTVTDNSSNGIHVRDNSHLTLSNSPDISNNGTEGQFTPAITLFTSSNAELSNVTISHNLHRGLNIGSHSNVQADNLTVEHNGESAIGITDNSSLEIQQSSIADNTQGVFMYGNSRAQFDFVQIINHAAATGLSVSYNSSVTGNNLTVTGNGLGGIAVDSGSGLALTDSTINNNGVGQTDLSLTFGSRLTLGGMNSFDTIFCDPSVLSRDFSNSGAPVCP